MISPPIRRPLVVASVLALSIAAFSPHAVAQAADAPSANGTRSYWSASSSFYNVPAQFTNKPGKVVRAEDFTGPITFPTGKNNKYPLRGKRIMYTSTQSDGAVTVTTGALLEPTADYLGKASDNPLVVLAPSTLGQGAQCAASRNINTFLGLSINNADGSSNTIDTVLREKTFDPSSINKDNPLTFVTDYEAVISWSLLQRGYRVFVIDYLDGGTGPQSYANNIEGGHAMLDAARAVREIGAISDKTPVGFWGFSQGGGATALGASLHARYAPEVNLVGAYLGSPPLDLMRVIDKIDGTVLMGAAGFATNAYAKRYPAVKQLTEQILNDDGKKVLKQLSHECVTEIVDTAGFRYTKELTRDGNGLKYHLMTNPTMQKLMHEQLSAALITPDVPVMVISNENDDVVDYQQVVTAIRHWAKNGASVTFYNVRFGPFMPGMAAMHMMPGFFILGTAMDYLEARFSGEPAPATSFNVMDKTLG